MSDRKVRDLLEEFDRLAAILNTPGVMTLPVRDFADALRRALDAPEAPQIIRTVEELEALDPDTLLIRRCKDWNVLQIPMLAQEWLDDWEIDPSAIFPLATIAGSSQTRG